MPRLVPDPRRGKNMWAVGLLCWIYDRDLEMVAPRSNAGWARRAKKVVDTNLGLVQAGYEWGRRQRRLPLPGGPAEEPTEPLVVMNGNQAAALGVMAAGIEVCAMYPITPATSVSHYLADANFHEVGGIVHQAEDEISAIGFALGASYAGKTAVTVTSGPGLALKTEFIGLAVMAELPLVIVLVQRGSPSTGLPTRVEQGDLLATVHGEPGDAPKIVMAPSNIEECFHFVVTARKLAETFRMPVLVLTDANLATGQQAFPGPRSKTTGCRRRSISNQDWDRTVPPYDWDPETGTLPAADPRSARGRLHPHRPGARREQQGGLRVVDQPARDVDAQPQADDAATHAAASEDLRRIRRATS